MQIMKHEMEEQCIYKIGWFIFHHFSNPHNFAYPRSQLNQDWPMAHQSPLYYANLRDI